MPIVKKKFLVLLSFFYIFSLVCNKSTITNFNKNVGGLDIKRDLKTYKYVIFDATNCFLQKSLYDILMSFRKKNKITFKGYLDLIQSGVAYAFGNLNAKKGYEIFFKHLKNMTIQDVKSKCKLIWEEDCKNYIYKDAFERFKQHKEDGLITIMVDAGISQLYDEFLTIYKFDYAFTSSLKFKDGLFTGSLSGHVCSNEHKYEMVKDLIENKLNGSLKDAIFYGNSHNDIPLLEHVGRPIVVNPNRKLYNVAKKKGWEILKFSNLYKK